MSHQIADICSSRERGIRRSRGGHRLLRDRVLLQQCTQCSGSRTRRRGRPPSRNHRDTWRPRWPVPPRPARERAEWIAKRDVIPIRKQCLVGLRVSIQYCGECEVALLDRSYEMTIEGRGRLRKCVSFAKDYANGSDQAEPSAFEFPVIQSSQLNVPPKPTAS